MNFSLLIGKGPCKGRRRKVATNYNKSGRGRLAALSSETGRCSSRPAPRLEVRPSGLKGLGLSAPLVFEVCLRPIKVKEGHSGVSTGRRFSGLKLGRGRPIGLCFFVAARGGGGSTCRRPFARRRGGGRRIGPTVRLRESGVGPTAFGRLATGRFRLNITLSLCGGARPVFSETPYAALGRRRCGQGRRAGRRRSSYASALSAAPSYFSYFNVLYSCIGERRSTLLGLLGYITSSPLLFLRFA